VTCAVKSFVRRHVTAGSDGVLAHGHCSGVNIIDFGRAIAKCVRDLVGIEIAA
jgi:hypothetical protein